MVLEAEWRATWLALSRRPATLAKAEVTYGVQILLSPTGLVLTRPALVRKGPAAARFVLFSMGRIGSGNSRFNEGVIGHFNPERLQDIVDKTFVALLPDVGKKTWVTGHCTVHFVLLLVKGFPEAGTTTIGLWKNVSQIRPPPSARGGASFPSATVSKHQLSALTSAP